MLLEIQCHHDCHVEIVCGPKPQIFSIKLCNYYLLIFYRDSTSKTSMVGKVITVHWLYYILPGAQSLDEIIKFKPCASWLQSLSSLLKAGSGCDTSLGLLVHSSALL